MKTEKPKKPVPSKAGKPKFKSNTEPKLTVSGVLKESWKLYRDNFKMLILITAFIFLVNIPLTILNIINSMVGDRIGIVYYMLLFVFALLDLYAALIIPIMTYIIIAERYKGSDIGIKSAFVAAKGKFWSYTGKMALFILIVLIPVYVMIFICENILLLDQISMIATACLIAIPAVYVYTIFNFAPLVAIFEEGKPAYFRISRHLVKGHFWKTALLTAGFFIISSGPNFIFTYINSNTDGAPISLADQFVPSSINQIAHIFITPFVSTVLVIVYYKLKEIKFGGK